ncbi:MAG TPA: 2-oxoglutarate dehydrogenase E1 component [Polyangia bacterium]
MSQSPLSSEDLGPAAAGQASDSNGPARPSADPYAAVSPANLAFLEDLYFQYSRDPDSVDPAWRASFGQLGSAEAQPPEAFSRSIFGGPRRSSPSMAGLAARPAVPATPAGGGANGAVKAHENGAGAVNGNAGDAVGGAGHVVAALVAAAAPLIRKTSSVSAERVQRLVEAYREMGHLSADLDPLGLVKRNAGASLDLAAFGLSEADLQNVFSSENVAGPDRATLADLIALLRETYCRHIGVELAHLHDVELRTWLLNRMESSRNRLDLSYAERRRLLEKVIDAEVFEQFLHAKFPGKKRFSLEGGESVIPLMDRLVERAALQGVREIVIGMAHRGRLNVLANVMEKPAAQIFAEFMDMGTAQSGQGGSGDVKYHLGYSVDRVYGANGTSAKVHLSLAFNPSHLEFVNTVVQGRVRAKQDRMGDMIREKALPILIHGDAAFAGQGVVAESLNMSELHGYRVGGTVHIVINNQVGFTTSPENGYSTTYATDVARMLQIPIFHVNAEDPEAIAQVVDLAVDFRQRFHRDALIEVWCYRKWGHNEGDEPEFTQPLMYRAIKSKGSVRASYLAAFRGRRFTEEGELTESDADEIAAARRRMLEAELSAAQKLDASIKPTQFLGAWQPFKGGTDASVPLVPTAISPEVFASVAQTLVTVPPDFTIHPKLTVLKDRAAMAAGEKPINWGMGEAMAFGSLLYQGVRVRLSGQDARRGTFSHRHSVLVDYNNAARYTPLSHVGTIQANGLNNLFEVRDSPLSEAGVLGFDYGYSLDLPEGLTIWEAQFGDFVNGAQVIIDQFIVSSEAKWNRVSGLVMLLPHGMEGQGPEHSSGRLERFLNMAVNDNIQVCNLTTPAQLFHVLRRQVLRPYRKPLIIMSPKSLLRHPQAVSTVEDFTNGAFRYVIADPTKPDPAKVSRILLCTGKVYYDLVAARAEQKRDDIAIIRIEQLYPLRKDELLDCLQGYREGTELIWVQEEPKNMGAWPYMNRELPGLLLGSFPWACVSRPLSASPAAGSEKRHKLEQAKLIEDAFGKGQS